MAVLKLTNSAPKNLAIATIFNADAEYSKNTKTKFISESPNQQTLEGQPVAGGEFKWVKVFGVNHPSNDVGIGSFVFKAANGTVLATIDKISSVHNIQYDYLVSNIFTSEAFAQFLFSQKDTIIGSSKNDKLFGYGENDRLFGGDGADKFDGGAGIDTAWYKTAVKIDLANLAKNTGEAKGDTFTGIEIIEGSKENDKLFGTSGVDKFFGMAGDDLLDGRDGHDELDGGKGDDVLKGGVGSDRLTGGEGKDDLYGGTGLGADRFIFNSAKDLGTSLITADRVFDLKGSDGDVLDFADPAIDLIQVTGAFTASNQFRLFKDGADTIVEFNLDTNLANADHFLRIVNWDFEADTYLGAILLNL